MQNEPHKKSDSHTASDIDQNDPVHLTQRDFLFQCTALFLLNIITAIMCMHTFREPLERYGALDKRLKERRR